MKERLKQPRQWLDILALVISAIAVILSVYTFYFSEFRLADNLTATFLGASPSSDTNGYFMIRTEIIFRNEGNRPAVIPRVKLALSETPTFDLTVSYFWSRQTPLVIEPKQSVHEIMLFGQGLIRNEMILSRGTNEPLIHARLLLDTLDSRGAIHQMPFDFACVKRQNGMIISTKVKCPYTFSVLPSTASPPLTYIEDTSCIGAAVSLRRSIQQSFVIINDGPLGFRLAGVYTNESATNLPPWPIKQPKMQGWGIQVD